MCNQGELAHSTTFIESSSPVSSVKPQQRQEPKSLTQNSLTPVSSSAASCVVPSDLVSHANESIAAIDAFDTNKVLDIRTSADGCIEIPVWNSKLESLLVDTGAGLDCIGDLRLPSSAVRHKLNRPIRLQGLGSQFATEFTKIPLHFSSGTLEWAFVIIPNSSLFLMGRPLLSKLDAIIRFDKGIMTISGLASSFSSELCVVIDETDENQPSPCRVEKRKLRGRDKRVRSCEIARKLCQQRVNWPCGATSGKESCVCPCNVDPPRSDEQLVDTFLADSEFSQAGVKRLKQILLKYPDVWKGELQPRLANVEPHRIELTSAIPVRCKLRVLTDDLKKLVEAELNKMVDAKVIRRSVSPYAALPVLVRKPDGSVRFCINYKPLNRVTKKDRGPLPRIDDLLMSLKGSKYFVALDLLSGYWQIPMAEEDIEKTAFLTHKGLYEWLVMPFGLTNAPATFQRSMDQLFGHLRFLGVLIYLDDLLCHHATEDGCLDIVEKVISILSSVNLKIKPVKCAFGKRKVQYLGFVLEEGCIRPNMQKVDVIKQLPAPVDISSLRRLLGLFGTYRKFIPNYASISEPLSRLFKKNVDFVWTEEQQQAHQQLKDSLVDVALNVPLDLDNLVLETDASSIAAGAILSIRKGDDLHPVEFASITFSEDIRKWTTKEKECYAIVWAVKKFDGYLRGRLFDLYTDHESLQWIWSSKIPKIERWAHVLQEYDVNIYHKSGKKLAHVDALSRLDPVVEENLPRMSYVGLCQVLQPVSMCPIFPRRQQTSFPTLSQILAAQKDEAANVKLSEQPDMLLVDTLWRYRNRLYIPASLRSRVLDVYHGSVLSGHPGTRKTCKKIRKIMNWPRLEEDVRRYIASCIICGRAKKGREKLQGLRRCHPVRAQPNELVAMDFWGPVTVGTTSIICLTIIDYATRWADAVIVPSMMSEDVVRALMSCWVPRFGMPKMVLTDNDTSFGAVFKEFETSLGVKVRTSQPYHPEGNGVIEVFHKFLRLAFCALDKYPVPPDMKLSLALWAYRSLPHESTGDTPSYLMMGFDVTLPYEIQTDDVCYANNMERLQALFATRQMVEEYMETKRELYEDALNRGRRDVKFEVGNLVMARNHRRFPAKLEGRWSFPCRVLQVSSDGRCATVRSLSSGVVADLHIEDAKFIQPPTTVQQELQWELEKIADLHARRNSTSNPLLPQRSRPLEAVMRDLLK